jgi:hypothetical protein
MTDYVLTGLVKRRAEVAGQIVAANERIQQLVADLEVLDAAILQFDPNYKVQAIRPRAIRPPSDWAKRGEMTKAVFNVLRLASEPLTSQDIATQLMEDQGIPPETNHKLFKLMVKRVSACLRVKREAGIVKATTGPGMWNLWEIIR